MNGMAKVDLQLEVNAINWVLCNKLNRCVCVCEPVCVTKMTDMVTVQTVM